MNSNYTPEAICQCLGLAGFEADPLLNKAKRAMRLLLMPSFHPETCITIADGKVSVVTAQSAIWQQFNPAAPVFRSADRGESQVHINVPSLYTLTNTDEGQITTDCFSQLITAFKEGTNVTQKSGIAIDGMSVDSLLFLDGSIYSRVQHNVAVQSKFTVFVAQAIYAAWSSLQNVKCKNMLSEAAKYVDLELLQTPEPPYKPTVKTLVLGPEEDRAQLIEALKKH